MTTINYAKKRTAHLIHDLQFGSTGKGLLAGFLTKKNAYSAVATAWGTNAGHTYIHVDHDGNEEKYVHTALANGAAFTSVRAVFVGAGSLVNPHILIDEVKKLSGRRIQNIPNTAYTSQLVVFVHESTTVVTEEHYRAEAASMVGIGSTQKGNGAALAQKIGRQVHGGNIARNYKALFESANKSPEFRAENMSIQVVSESSYRAGLRSADKLLIEGAQGFSLGLNQQFYPYCTSRECTPAQIATDCGVPMHWLTEIYGTMRAHPIRVSNRYKDDDPTKEQIGWSGDCYRDQHETTWEEIGVPSEQTTVTKRDRRVFTFSAKQIRDALETCGTTQIFLNFANYLEPAQVVDLVDEVNDIAAATLCNDDIVTLIGRGATGDDVQAVPCRVPKPRFVTG